MKNNNIVLNKVRNCIKIKSQNSPNYILIHIEMTNNYIIINVGEKNLKEYNNNIVFNKLISCITIYSQQHKCEKENNTVNKITTTYSIHLEYIISKFYPIIL